MGKKRVPFHVPSVDYRELNALRMPEDGNWLAEGRRVKEFEDLFLKFSGGKNARAVSSCTAALHTACILSGAERGRKVIVPVYTFAASANAVIYSGADPVFVDSSKDSPNIGLDELQKIKTDQHYTALISVNVGGIPCRLDKLSEFAKSRGLGLVQDCSHSVESEYQGRPVGDYGDFACYSFQATKNITTSDGGMLVYSDEGLARDIDQIIHHGMDSYGSLREGSDKPWDYNVVRLGYKYNMTDLQASIGIVQLCKLQENYLKRKSIYSLYTEMLRDVPCIGMSALDKGAKTSFHLFQVFIMAKDNPRTRDLILHRLHEKGISCSVHFKPLHIHPFYQKVYSFREDDFPNSMHFYRSSISLPIFPLLKKEDAVYVCDTLKSIIKELNI